VLRYCFVSYKPLCYICGLIRNSSLIGNSSLHQTLAEGRWVSYWFT